MGKRIGKRNVCGGGSKYVLLEFLRFESQYGTAADIKTQSIRRHVIRFGAESATLRRRVAH